MSSRKQPTKSAAPIIPLEVVEYLERQFKPRRIPLTISDREIWYQQGQTSVADLVRAQYELQQKGRGELPRALTNPDHRIEE
jgi:hypothetical protein